MGSSDNSKEKTNVGKLESFLGWVMRGAVTGICIVFYDQIRDFKQSTSQDHTGIAVITNQVESFTKDIEELKLRVRQLELDHSNSKR